MCWPFSKFVLCPFLACSVSRRLTPLNCSTQALWVAAAPARSQWDARKAGVWQELPVSSALSSMRVVLQWVLKIALSSFPWAFPSHVSFLSLFSALESVPSSQYLYLHNLGRSLPCWNLIWYKRELSFCVYNLYVCVPACSVMSNSLWPMDYSLPGSCPLLLLGESVGLSRQEYWSSLLFPPSGDLPTPGLNPHLLHWQANSSPLHHQWGIIYVSFCGIQIVHRFLLFLSF